MKTRRGLCRCGLFFLSFLTACHEGFFPALRTTCVALSTSDNVNHRLSAVFSTRSTRTMRLTECPTFTPNSAQRRESVMAPSFCCLRAVAPHSDYHSCASIAQNPKKAKGLALQRTPPIWHYLKNHVRLLRQAFFAFRSTSARTSTSSLEGFGPHSRSGEIPLREHSLDTARFTR